MDDLKCVSTGNLIELFSEQGGEDGFISSGGNSDEQIIIKTHQDKSCVFRVLPMKHYGEERGSSNRENQDVDNVEAKPIIYGQIIELQQRKTGKWVSVINTGDHDMSGFSSSCPLHLANTGTKSCWFKILPHSQGEEGEKVMEGDKVKLVNVATGFVLHQSESLNSDNQYEVDVRSHFTSSDVTSWTIKLSDIYNQHLTLKNGSTVRFFHETCGYLVGKEKQQLRTKFYFFGNDKVSSFSTIWEVLEESLGNLPSDLLLEGEIIWNKRVQLKLFGTQFYLTLLNSIEESENQKSSFQMIRDSDQCELSLTEDGKDPNTFFIFVPTKKEKEEVSYGNQLWIQSANSKHWIQCSEDFSYQIGKKNYYETDIYGTRKFSPKNVFTVKSVAPSQLKGYSFVEENMDFLADYLAVIKRTMPTKTDRKNCKNALTNLISFCSDNLGYPIRGNQLLLGTPARIKMIVDIANIGNKQDIQITALAWKLLKEVVKYNIKNGKTLSNMIVLPVFSSPAEVDSYKAVPVAETLIEMYRKNADLIYGLKQEFVWKIFQLLISSGDSRFFDFLGSVCYFGDVVIHNNQRIVASLLEANLGQVIRKFYMDIKTSEVSLDTSKGKVSLIQFTAPRQFPQDEVEYVYKLLSFYSHLAIGRNKTSINLITSPSKVGLSFPLVFHCLKHPFILPNYRSAFCDIMLHVFVDVYPQTPMKTAFKTIWCADRIPKGVDDEIIDIDYAEYLKMPTTDPNVSINEPENLQKFIVSYVFDKIQTRFDQTQRETNQPQLLLRIIVLLRHCFFFGFFEGCEGLIMWRIKELLNIDPDEDHQQNSRTLPPGFVDIIMDIKLECLEILERYVQMMVESLFEYFMISNPSLGSKQNIINYLRENLGGPKNLLPPHQETQEFLPILLKLIEHGNSLLTCKALTIRKQILLLGNKNLTLLRLAKKVQFLQSAEVYSLIQGYLGYSENSTKNMLQIASYEMNHTRKTELIEILKTLCGLCIDDHGEVNRTNQDICYNSTLYEEILLIIKRPIDTEHKLKQTAKNEIVIACYNFLTAFCTKNSHNQKALYNHLEYMTHQMILYQDYQNVTAAITETCTEMFRGNLELCNSLTEKHILPFVQTIIMYPDEVLLDFFRIIIKPCGEVLKSNQNLVLKLLTMSTPDFKELLNNPFLHQKNLPRRLGLQRRGKDVNLRDSLTASDERRIIHIIEEKKDKKKQDQDSSSETETESKSYSVVELDPIKEEEKLLSLEEEKEHDGNASDRVRKRLSGSGKGKEIEEEKKDGNESDRVRMRLSSKGKELEDDKNDGNDLLFKTQKTRPRKINLHLKGNYKGDDLPQGAHLSSRGEFIKKTEYSEMDPRSTLITLLSICAEGRNYYTEATCQKYLSLDECISLASKTSMDNVKIFAAYVHFADEVWLNTENEVYLLPIIMALQQHKGIYQILSVIQHLLDKSIEVYSAAFLGSKLSIFIFEVLLPFLDHFYAKCVSPATVSDKLKKMSNQLVDTIYDLRNLCKNIDQEKNFLLLTTLRIIVCSCDIYGLKDPSKISKLMNSAISNPLPIKRVPLFVDEKSLEERRFWNNISRLSYRILKKINPKQELDSESEGDLESTSADLEDYESSQQYLEIVVNAIARYRAHKDDKLTILCLRILAEYFDIDKHQTSNKAILDNAAKLDAPHHVMNLLSSKNKIIVGLALECLCLMLTEVENGVQSTSSVIATILHRNFTTPGIISPFHYIGEFFDEASTEIRNFKFYLLSASMNKSVFASVLELDFSNAYVPSFYPESSFYSLILKLMKLLASNPQSSIFKNLLVKNDFDIIKKLSFFVKEMEPIISKHNMELVTQLFYTLTVFVMNSTTNQNTALAAQILVPVNKLLMSDIREKNFIEGEIELDILGEDAELVQKTHLLKLSLVEFLIALVEDADGSVTEAVMNSIKSVAFEKNTHVLTEKYTITDSNVPTNLASKSFRLIKYLVENAQHYHKDYRDSLEICETHCKSRIGRIEVIHKNKIEINYFPIPEDFRKTRSSNKGIRALLFDKVKKNQQNSYIEVENTLNQRLDVSLSEKNINWDRAGDRVDAFIAWSTKELLKREKELPFKNENVKFLYKITRFWNSLLWLTFILSIIINFILLFTEDSDKTDTPGINIPIIILGIIQTIISFFTFISYLLRKAGVVNARKWLAKLKGDDECYMLMPFEKLKELKFKKIYRYEIFYWLISIWNVMTHPYAMFYFIYVVFSFLGNIISPYFFAFHLFQIVLRSARLKIILYTITSNLFRLFIMFVLLIFVVYIFSIISFIFYPMQYYEPNGVYCKSLVQCFSTNLIFGVNSGGALFQYTLPYFIDFWSSSEIAYGFGWVVFVVLWFFAVGPIMLNTTFAIIVDTFGHLRERETVAQQALTSNCFICCLERDVFHKKAKDFTTHIEREHNRLHYFYFFAYLKDSETKRSHSDLSLLEQDVKKMVNQKKFLKFFPIGKASSLEAPEEDQVNEKLLSSVKNIERQIQQSAKQQEKLFKQTTDANRQLQFLFFHLKKTQEELEAVKEKFKK